jgi:hypothetical protein
VFCLLGPRDEFYESSLLSDLKLFIVAVHLLSIYFGDTLYVQGVEIDAV